VTAAPRHRPTAGVVVIGNEVLSGKVDEQNVALFVRRFRELGVALSRVAIITDDLDDIATTVADFAARFDIVCTTGGIGPTHDDLTIDGVARAMKRSLELNPELVRLIQAHLDRRGRSMNEGYRRMARAPSGCELVGDPRWPTVKVDNVFIFPGVPALLVKKFEVLAQEHFRGAELWTGELEADALESEVVDALDAIVVDHPQVEIGSYPQMGDGDRWTLKITAEATTPQAVQAALAAVAEALGERVFRTTEPQSTDGQ